jgi:hypothetical protein
VISVSIQGESLPPCTPVSSFVISSPPSGQKPHRPTNSRTAAGPPRTDTGPWSRTPPRIPQESTRPPPRSSLVLQNRSPLSAAPRSVCGPATLQNLPRSRRKGRRTHLTRRTPRRGGPPPGAPPRRAPGWS